jgi:BMFP domain-containing protein YqiC
MSVSEWSFPMTQTQNRVLDEIARMFTNAAGAAQGVRQEVETVIRSQAERLVADLDLVPREEFEVVRDMAALAREENEALRARIEALETALAKKSKTVRPEKPAAGDNQPE